MKSPQPPASIAPALLRYLGTSEHVIDSRLSLHIAGSEECLFGFVLRGSLSAALDPDSGPASRTARVMQGEVFLVPAYSSVLLQNTGRQPATAVLIRFEHTALPPVPHTNPRHAPQTADSVFDGGGPFLHFRMPRLHAWIQDMLQDGGEEMAARSYEMQSHLYAIAAELSRHIAKPGRLEEDLADYVDCLRQHMLENYSDDMDMEETSRLSGASTTRFYQMFKRVTGFSPLQFITRVRLRESLRLLAGTPTSVMDAAHAVGYEDELYFSRLFKKHIGLSPTQYASFAKKRIANLCPVFRGDLSVLGITPVLELEREWYEDPHKEKYIRAVRQSAPELILTAPVEEAVYEALSRIAPVYVIPWKGPSWKDRLRRIAQLLQMPSVAEHWLAGYHQKVEQARVQLRARLGERPFLVVSLCSSFFRVYGLQRLKIQDLFYDELQVRPPASAQEISFLDTAVLREVAELGCGNVMFLVPSWVPEESCRELEEEWMELGDERMPKQCLFIRHQEPLLYNASFYERLIEHTVSEVKMFG